MKTIIVDDNIIARATLVQLARRLNYLQVIAECSDAFEVYHLLLNNTIDLILLDIEMPGMTGLELTRQLGNKRPIVIFTTSKKEYAAEAFDLNVADYIVKPVLPARFVQAVDKAKEIFESNREEVKMDNEQVIFIRDSSVVRRIRLDDILYLEAMGDYVKLHTPQKFFAIHSTLKAVEDRLSSTMFIRVHRSYIVAVAKIDTVLDGTVNIGGKLVPVADAYRGSLTRRLNIL